MGETKAMIAAFRQTEATGAEMEQYWQRRDARAAPTDNKEWWVLLFVPLWIAVGLAGMLFFGSLALSLIRIFGFS